MLHKLVCKLVVIIFVRDFVHICKNCSSLLGFFRPERGTSQIEWSTGNRGIGVIMLTLKLNVSRSMCVVILLRTRETVGLSGNQGNDVMRGIPIELGSSEETLVQPSDRNLR